jgi:hypothetical protein
MTQPALPVADPAARVVKTPSLWSGELLDRRGRSVDGRVVADHDRLVPRWADEESLAAERPWATPPTRGRSMISA